MANSYFPVTATTILPCSEEDYNKLEEDYGDVMSDAGIITIFSKAKYDRDQGLYIYSDFGIDQETLDNEEGFRKFVGSIIEKAGLPYWEFGEAQYCSKPRVGTCRGTFFRWGKDGVIVWAIHVYPDFIEAAKGLVNEVISFLDGDHIWDYHKFPRDEQSKSTKLALKSLHTALRRTQSFPWTAIKESKRATTDSNT